MALFRAYHVDKRDIANPLELLNIAEELGIDTTEVAEDLRTRKFKEVVGADHEEGDEKYDIFGVPTIVFNGEQPTFIKLAEGEWEGTDEDVSLFHDIYNVSAPRSYMMEIKKPASAASASASAARRAQEGN
jgi:protein-disulfide isomerase-like protein with CxxC motif